MSYIDEKSMIKQDSFIAPDEEEDEHDLIMRNEIHEQLCAQIAALAVDIPHVSILEGIQSTIKYRRAHRKTKAEWNKERVRDFRVCKDGSDDKAKAEEAELEHEIEEEVQKVSQSDTASSFLVNADPNPYLRNYDHSSYVQGLRQLKAKNASVGSIRVLDLCGQLIGDEKFAEVCYSLRRCPLHVLNLSENNLTDAAMGLLSDVLRSLGGLDDLLLSHNDISDEGVDKIFGAKVYPPHLHKVDLSFNALGPKAAFTLGRMFQGDRTCRLNSLYLGGKVNKKGWGDEFVRILVDFLTRPHARILKKLSIPNAGLAHDGISAIAAYVSCGQEIHYLNITQNSLMEPVSRRFLRDALRSSKSMHELACGSSGISRVERAALEFACVSKYELTWSERISLSYQVAKELNRCNFLGHAVELVVTNNWQAAKPIPWHELETGDPSAAAEKLAKERAQQLKVAEEEGKDPSAEDGEEAVSEFLHIPFSILTMKMELTLHASNALKSIDELNKFVLTLIQEFDEAEKWLDDNITSFRQPHELRSKGWKLKQRQHSVMTRKDNLLTMLEKFTSIAIVKSEKEARGKKGKKKKKKKKGKEEVSQSWKKGAKGQRVTIEAILLTIEELRSSYVEYADALQYLIGVCYLLRVRHLDAARKKRKAEQVSTFTSKKEALAFTTNKNKKVDEPFGSEASIPYLKNLGIAGSYTFFLHVGAPAEHERMKRSLLAFEADRKRQESISAKEEKRKRTTRKLKGPRFQIFPRGTFPTPRDEEKELEMDAKDIGLDDGPAENETKYDDDEEEEEDDEEEEESSEEEEDDDDDDGDGSKNKVRERTRFLVPKREMQRKYESIFVEDLTNDKAAIKNLISQMCRANRRHVIRTMEVPLVMSNDGDPGPPTTEVSIFVEVEEDRSEPLEPLSRLDPIRPRISFEERVRARRSAHQYIREELASTV